MLLFLRFFLNKNEIPVDSSLSLDELSLRIFEIEQRQRYLFHLINRK